MGRFLEFASLGRFPSSAHSGKQPKTLKGPSRPAERCLKSAHHPTRSNTNIVSVNLRVARTLFFSCALLFLREMEVQRRRGTTSPDPEKIPEPLRGPLGGFPVGILREEKNP